MLARIDFPASVLAGTKGAAAAGATANPRMHWLERDGAEKLATQK